MFWTSSCHRNFPHPLSLYLEPRHITQEQRAPLHLRNKPGETLFPHINFLTLFWAISLAFARRCPSTFPPLVVVGPEGFEPPTKRLRAACPILTRPRAHVVNVSRPPETGTFKGRRNQACARVCVCLHRGATWGRGAARRPRSPSVTPTSTRASGDGFPGRVDCFCA